MYWPHQSLCQTLWTLNWLLILLSARPTQITVNLSSEPRMTINTHCWLHLPRTCCQLSTDWEHTFYCLRCRSWQQVLGKWSQQWVFIGIHDPELKSTVFWVVLAVSKISSQFSVHSVWHSDRCSRRMFHHVLCQEPEALQRWLAASRLTAVTGCGWLISMYRNL